MGAYDNLTLNNGTYINTYQGSPLNEIADTASELSGRHYANLAKLNQIELLGQQAMSKALPGAKSYIQDHINGIQTALEELTKSGAENSTSVVNSLANKFLGDQGMLAASNHAAEYQKFLDTQKTLKGQGMNPIHNKALEQSYLNSSVVDPETGKMSSIYNDPFKLQSEPYVEPTPIIDELWKPITPSSTESVLGKKDYLMLSKLMPEVMDGNGMIDMPLFYEMTKKQGISQQTINKFTNAVKRQYMSTEGGRQFKDLGEANGTVSEGQLNDLILQRGLMRVFSNEDRQVVGNNLGDELVRANLKAKSQPIQTPTLAPGTVIKNAVPYSEDGIIPNVSMITRFPEERKMLTPEEVKQIEEKDKNPDFHPQYLKDLGTAAQVFGKTLPNPNTPEAKELVKLYNDYRNQRVNNAWTIPISHDESIDRSDEIQRQFALHQYMDEKGNVISPTKDGKITDEFIELTGGDPSTFKVESVYDVKNHFATAPNSNENFIQPIAVVALSKDGKTRRFLASQQLGFFNVQPVEKNINKIYSFTNMNPGQEVDLGSGVKATSLFGNQLASIPREDVEMSSYPITASVPGISGGKKLLYNSAEHLADVLANPAKYNLTINPIYLNIK